MRLAYFASKFPATSETFILNEMISLVESGCDVDMFAFRRPPGQQQHPQTGSFLRTARYADNPFALVLAQFVYLWRAPLRIGSLWFTLFRFFGMRPALFWRNLAALLAGTYFARSISAGNYDHLHAHWANHSSFAAYCAAKLTGLPYSITAHANDIYVDQSMLAEKARWAAYLITISDYNRRWLRNFVNASDQPKIKVIRCGIDLRKFTMPTTRATSRRPVFVCLARLNKKKGHRYLLDACARLVEQGGEFECRLIGTGDLESLLRAQVERNGLSRHVRFLGALSQPDVIQQLAQADFMVLPSITLASGRREGIPVSLMEGMAMGLAVIATDLSGIPELVQDGYSGLLVPEQDSIALARAMHRLLSDSSLAEQLALNGRRIVCSQYDLHKNSQELLALFRKSSKSHKLKFAEIQAASGD